VIYGPACIYTSPIKIGDRSSNLLFISTLFSFHKKKKKVIFFIRRRWLFCSYFRWHVKFIESGQNWGDCSLWSHIPAAMRKSLHLSFYSHFNSLDSQALALLVTSACLLFIYIFLLCVYQAISILFFMCMNPYLRSLTSCRMPFICLQKMGQHVCLAWYLRSQKVNDLHNF
jgi:hypothetical protein